MQVPPLYQTPPHGGGDDGQARGRVLHRRSDGYGDDGEVCSVWASEPLGRHRLGVAVLGDRLPCPRERLLVFRYAVATTHRQYACTDGALHHALSRFLLA